MKRSGTFARTHHEQWDGAGYPRGPTGEQIPPVDRIVAVWDVFDALTSERPYKDEWPVERAINELKALSGYYFDPKLIDRFIEILPEILKIKEQYKDSNETEQAFVHQKAAW